MRKRLGPLEIEVADVFFSGEKDVRAANFKVQPTKMTLLVNDRYSEHERTFWLYYTFPSAFVIRSLCFITFYFSCREQQK